MAVKLKLSALAEGHWYEYAIRFVLGGAVTMLAGWIATEWGPMIGGLFLAFPAIFPASATLVEKHECERKENAGLRGAKRGRDAAALEAAGAALWSIGLCNHRMAVRSSSSRNCVKRRRARFPTVSRPTLPICLSAGTKACECFGSNAVAVQ
jgi:hypothetical protein